MLSRLAAHFSRYSLASLLVTLASIISFPFLTRIFSVAEYGMMSLIGVMVTATAAVGKLGLQQAALRFYSEVRAGQSPWSLSQYESTVYLSLAGFGTLAALIWAGVVSILPDTLFSQPDSRALLYLVAPLALLQCLSSSVINQLRAREMSGVLSLYSVLQRYLGLGLMLVVLMHVSRTLWGFYGAQIVAESLCLLALCLWFFRRHPWSPANFSAPLLRTLLTFSLPLVVMELSSVMLSLGDRVLIERLMDTAALGIYSAPYNLCDYIGAVLVMAFTSAVTPMVLRLWADEGEAATQDFLQRVFHLYALFAVPMVAGVSAVAEPLLALVASEKYRSGASIIPWVISGIALQGLFPVASAGLQIQKRSVFILVSILSAALLNIVLNLVLIPVAGIDGAAIATFLGYVLMLGLAAWLGRHTVSVRPEPYRLGVFVLASGLMYGALMQIDTHHDLLTLVTRVAAGALIYPVVTMLLDRHSRDMAQQTAARLGLIKKRV
ncbi:MAG: lipopolysaccharide biosynthesis protein [Lautropia sp.]|nr:lipopolysaccharide biosynthesis protein [Lautropia sp.]